jgi:hypothetical protein
MMQAKIRKMREIVYSLSAKSRTEPAQEEIYQYLFTRDLRAIGIEDNFYPVGSAANYSLLYLVLRCLRELRFTGVLELGCGQTTLLIDQVRRRLGLDCRVTSIEHDAFWARSMAAKVGHEIVTAPLERLEVAGRAIDYYRLDAIAGAGRRFDFVIVDGPPAYTPATRYARLGCVAVLDRCLAPDFVLVLDDTARDGEADAVAACRNLLTARGIEFQESQIAAAKRQHLFCTPAYATAAFF